MLPVSKNSVLQLLLGISYTGAIGFHKCMGWFFVIVSAIHVSVYVKSASLDSLTSVTSHMFNMVEHHHEGTGHAEVSKNAWGKSLNFLVFDSYYRWEIG